MLPTAELCLAFTVLGMGRDLRRKAAELPRVGEDARLAVCARDAVRGSTDLAVTAADIFAV
jgi:hypothetical protein